MKGKVHAMKKRKAKSILLACCAGIGMISGMAAGGSMSDSTVVFLRSKESFLWSTASNATLSLPVVYPKGATSANLSVSGHGYSANYPEVPEGDFLLTLPAATSPSSENVYDLTLSFDNDMEQRARIGLVYGVVGGAEGSTRCLAPVGSYKWRQVNGRAVLPVPSGITSFAVDFSDGRKITDSGLNGAAGWYPIALSHPVTAMLSMAEANGTQWSVTLNGILGLVITVR